MGIRGYTSWGPGDPGNSRVESSLAFLFCFPDPRPEAEETSNLDSTFIAGRNTNWYSHSGKQLGSSLKSRQEIPRGPAMHLCIYLREVKASVHTSTYMGMFIAALFPVTRVQTLPGVLQQVNGRIDPGAPTSWNTSQPYKGITSDMAATWVKGQRIMMAGRSQSQSFTYWTTPLHNILGMTEMETRQCLPVLKGSWEQQCGSKRPSGVGLVEMDVLGVLAAPRSVLL